MVVALVDSSPSLVQIPPLAQAHISTMGVKVDEAPLESLAKNVRESVVTSCKFQRRMYSFSPMWSKAELGGSPPSTVSVISSPGSSTRIVYADSCPRVTLKTISAEMFGGKLAVKDESSEYFLVAIASCCLTYCIFCEVCFLFMV